MPATVTIIRATMDQQAAVGLLYALVTGSPLPGDLVTPTQPDPDPEPQRGRALGSSVYDEPAPTPTPTPATPPQVPPAPSVAPQPEPLPAVASTALPQPPSRGPGRPRKGTPADPAPVVVTLPRLDADQGQQQPAAEPAASVPKKITSADFGGDPDADA